VHPNGGIGWDGSLMPFPWWAGSVAEAIFLISAERNGDKIIGATYAPGLRNMNRWQWSMTQIQHAADPGLTTLSTSYHVWAVSFLPPLPFPTTSTLTLVSQLLAKHIIRRTLPVTAPPGAPNFNPLYYVAGASEKGTRIFKASVYNSTEPVPVSLQFEGVPKGAKASLTVLTGPSDQYAYKEDTKVVRAGEKGTFTFSLPALSVAVLETEDRYRL